MSQTFLVKEGEGEKEREQAGGLGDEDYLFWGCRTSSRKNVLTSLVALRGLMVVE